MESVKKTNPSYEELVNNYNVQFSILQQSKLKHLDVLITKGIKDYRMHKGKWFSLAKLSNAYLKKATDLEKETDEEFNYLLNSLKRELVKHSFDTEIVHEHEAYYNDYKTQLRKKLLSKVKQFI